MSCISLTRAALAAMFGLLSHTTAMAAEALPEPGWVQIEMTVFTHENSNPEAEVWSPQRLSLGFPERLQRLDRLSDLLQLDDWSPITGILPTATPSSPVAASPTDSTAPQAAGAGTLSALLAPLPVVITGPLPFLPGESFRLPDMSREPFIALPEGEHDFNNTVRALSQSADYRILYHDAWRQPLLRRNAARAVAVQGGRAFNERSELEGSVVVYAGNAQGSLVADANLWLTSFVTTDAATQEWELPVLPAVLVDARSTAASAPTNGEAGAATNGNALTPDYFVNRIVQLRETRDMRHGEFHYLDHPALGVLIQVTPYEVPPLPIPEPEADAASSTALPAAQ